MSEPTLTDLYAFRPMFGGHGVRLTCSSVNSRAVFPGLQGQKDVRLIISNGGSVSAFIAFGQSDVVADSSCMEILPGTQVSMTLDDFYPQQLYIAGVTESATTNVQFTAGKGS